MKRRPVIPWSPFPRKALPSRFPTPTRHPKKAKKIIPWDRNDWHVLKGDFVEILVGKDKGKQGKIREVARSKNLVFVQGLNMYHRYMKPYQDFPGGQLPFEEPIHAADVKLVDPETGNATDIVWRYNEDGKRVRVSLDSGKIIPKPPWERSDFKSRDAVPDGEFDTLVSDASKETFVPSMLLFHEEIMKTMDVKPTIPKTEPDVRDVIMAEIKKDALTQPSSVETKLSETPPLYMTMAFYLRNTLESLKFWKS
eukprot:gene9586-10573_t